MLLQEVGDPLGTSKSLALLLPSRAEVTQASLSSTA